MYLVIDTETGGRTPDHALLQLYARVVDKSLKATDELNLLLVPDDGKYVVTSGALRINGINLAKHSEGAMLMSSARNKLRQWLAGHTKGGTEKLTVVGWNVSFDTGFVHAHLLPKDEWEGFCSYRHLDVAAVVSALQLKGKIPASVTSLVKTAQFFGLKTDGAHEASFDVDMTVAVLRCAVALI